MNDPIIFISRNRVKDGMLAEFMQALSKQHPKNRG